MDKHMLTNTGQVIESVCACSENCSPAEFGSVLKQTLDSALSLYRNVHASISRHLSNSHLQHSVAIRNYQE